jgi:hypothetical protein
MFQRFRRVGMNRERIEDMREVVLPFVKKRLLETNYEGLGEDDAKEFEREFNEILNLAIKGLEQEPTTKNDSSSLEKNSKKLEKDFGELDCIDRAELLKAMDTWDKFGYTARYGLERLDKDDKDFVPYVKYDDMVNCVKNMPPATPIRPKGHWIYDKSFANWVCSKCGETPKTIGYVGTGAFMAEHFKYCNHCGAEMEGSEEV